MTRIQRLKNVARHVVEASRDRPADPSAGESSAPDPRVHELLDAAARLEALQTESVTGSHPRKHRALEKAAQLQLQLTYRELIAAGRPLPSFADAQLRFYSQSGEDGIIQMLLAAVGTETRKTVEVCAGDGIECNSANLIVNHGWTGLLVDGGEELVTRGKRFYEDGADTWYWPPVLKRSWVTRDNVNDLITDAGFAGEIDMLTVDLDGMDYWVWEALDSVRSRIVVVEYNSGLGPDDALTVPYSEDFAWTKGTQYLGASLAAMIKLGKRKGYRFVGTNLYGFNAFFVRDDLAQDSLPEGDPQLAFQHAAPTYSMSRINEVRHLEWAEV